MHPGKQPDWLKLPNREWAPFTSTSLQYGAGKVASSHSNLGKIPAAFYGVWAHGWTPDFFCDIDPHYAFGDSLKKNQTSFVGTKCLERYLRKNDYPAKAIGLPIAYLPDRKYKRKPNSLLVMPTHSLDYTKHSWKFEEYARQIFEIKNDFAEVWACVHTSCIKNGYWVNQFLECGIPVIEGAHATDRNSLERIRALASQFEFITTNGFGSHIAYGSAFGAKVYIFGKFSEFRTEDYSNCPFFQTHPGLLEKAETLNSELFLKSQLTEFFCHPREAEERVEWGLEQIGFNNRISPSEMRLCFGWEWYHEPLRKAKTYFHIGANKLLTRKMRTALDEWGSPQLKARNSEMRRIESLPEGQSGSAALEGLSLHFEDPQRFLREYRRIFLEKALDVPCIKGSPVILDWGAGIGLPMRYWANKFPAPEIHLFEPDEQMRESLAQNAAEAINAIVQIHENAGKLAGLLNQPVDFLLIDLLTHEIELLDGLGDRIRAAERILVTCRTEIGKDQQVSKVLELLENHGFRYHLSPRNASVNPLVELRSQHGADCVVDVWGYRGDKFPRTL